ncbi:MAG TPA: PqqD family protein [Solirubrobacteraceae bacterium]|nr:PqqD family protein [Solirubrobacteraceae bacterium]
MSIHPVARTEGVFTETLDDELLLYDEERDIACRLNRSAALVWRHADGQRSVPELVQVLRAEIGDVADEDLVLVTLDRLDEEGLLEAGYERREPSLSRLSRRRFIGRVGAVSTAALALPVVQSIVAPTPAAAASYYYRQPG